MKDNVMQYFKFIALAEQFILLEKRTPAFDYYRVHDLEDLVQKG